MKRGKGEKNDANYQLPPSAKDKVNRMGRMDFANLPQEPKYMGFAENFDYRDGIVNSFTNSIVDISDIRENQK